MTRNKKYTRISTLLFLVAGIGLFYWVANKFNLSEAISTIKRGSYYNVPAIIFISFMSYWCRVQRWRMLVKASGHTASFSDGLIALSIGYTINYAIPRFGEVARSLILWRRQKTPFELNLGTVLMERAVDILALLAVCIAALALQFQKLYGFVNTWMVQPFQHKLSGAGSLMWWVAGAVVFLFALFYISRRFYRSGMVQNSMHSFMTGLMSVRKVKPATLFVVYTAGIWTCYFLMTYLWTFSFPESAGIGALAAFVVMVMGTIGRSLPVQGGGMGVYHSIVTPAFMLYGVNQPVAFALAIIIHGAQGIFTCLMGLICYVWMSVLEFRNR